MCDWDEDEAVIAVVLTSAVTCFVVAAVTTMFLTTLERVYINKRNTANHALYDLSNRVAWSA
jgi:hypothetical protein